MVQLGQGCTHVHGRRRLADAALLVGDSDDPGKWATPHPGRFRTLGPGRVRRIGGFRFDAAVARTHLTGSLGFDVNAGCVGGGWLLQAPDPTECVWVLVRNGVRRAFVRSGPLGFARGRGLVNARVGGQVGHPELPREVVDRCCGGRVRASWACPRNARRSDRGAPIEQRSHPSARRGRGQAPSRPTMVGRSLSGTGRPHLACSTCNASPRSVRSAGGGPGAGRDRAAPATKARHPLAATPGCEGRAM